MCEPQLFHAPTKIALTEINNCYQLKIKLYLIGNLFTIFPKQFQKIEMK